MWPRIHGLTLVVSGRRGPADDIALGKIGGTISVSNRKDRSRGAGALILAANVKVVCAGPGKCDVIPGQRKRGVETLHIQVRKNNQWTNDVLQHFLAAAGKYRVRSDLQNLRSGRLRCWSFHKTWLHHVGHSSVFGIKEERCGGIFVSVVVDVNARAAIAHRSLGYRIDTHPLERGAGKPRH